MKMLSMVAALLALAQVACADVSARVEDAFRTWAQDIGAPRAVLTLWQDGKRLTDVSLGDVTADTPMELASLSKAITAVCVADLITGDVWSAQTTSSEVLGIGPEGITVAALLTHSGGILPDRTQRYMTFWLGTARSRADGATHRALTRKAQQGQARTYAYNNENYAILGEMIAAETGQSYIDACTRRVLKPAGVTTARPSPRTGAFLPWGGWQMSVADYARFMQWAYGPQGVIGAASTTLPAHPISEHVSYGMGMVQRPWGAGYNFWHFGSLCFMGRMTAGSYAVRWQNGYTLVAAYDRCLEDAQMAALDAAIIGAVFQ